MYDADQNYFGARYYSSALGRFLTPDWSEAPEPVPYADLGNPQSLNLYSYVLNNPATATDPDGHICCFAWLSDLWNDITGDTAPPPAASNCGNPCVVNSTPEQFPLLIRPVALIAMTGVATLGRLAPRPLTAAETQQLLQLPRMGASPFGPPEGELAEAGGGVIEASSGQIAQAERILATQGRTALERGLRNLEKRLGSHLADLDQYRATGGYTSKTLAEIRNFRQLIEAYRFVLGK